MVFRSAVCGDPNHDIAGVGRIGLLAYGASAVYIAVGSGCTGGFATDRTGLRIETGGGAPAVPQGDTFYSTAGGAGLGGLASSFVKEMHMDGFGDGCLGSRYRGS